MYVTGPSMRQQALPEKIGSGVARKVVPEWCNRFPGRSAVFSSRIAAGAHGGRRVIPEDMEPGTPLLFLNAPWGRVAWNWSSCGKQKSGPRLGNAGLVERKREVIAMASGPAPLIAATDHWGTWTVLLTAAAFGLW